MSITGKIFAAMYKLGTVKMNVAQIAGTAGISEKTCAEELVKLHKMGHINGRSIDHLKIPVEKRIENTSHAK